MTPPAIALTGVRVRLGNYVALDRFSFSIPSGTFLAILGPNGAGKTTLLKLLLGLVAPDEGEVRIFGEPPERAPHIAYIPQTKTLDRSFPAAAIELVATGLNASWPTILRSARRELALEMLRRVGAEHLAERQIGQLSGGELQRIYLARSLAREPRLILLDEPATGMDASGQSDMYHMLEQYRASHGATILMITHDWNVAYHHAAQVLLMNRRPISFGPPREALSEDYLREAFGHVGHAHAMTTGPAACA